MILMGRRIWIGGRFVPARITIEDGIIARVEPYEKDERGEAIDCGEERLVPGFIDLHTHGAYGFDTDDGDPEGLRRWAQKLPEEGVTSFLPTAAVQSPQVLMKALSAVDAAVCRQERDEPEGEAQILGAHLEGPCLSLAFAGAQDKKEIHPLSEEELEQYQEAAGGRIRRITLAPEEDQDFRLTRFCSLRGITVSLGHSQADYQRVLMAAANGASSVTHVYNGMSGFHHRSPGMVGAALTIPDLYGEIICDGLHCHPAALGLFFQAKGGNTSIMITDSLSVKGCRPGDEGRLGKQMVVMGDDGLGRLKDSQVIAGSTLFMNQGLRLLVEQAGVPFGWALNSCTLNPARCLGLEHRKGRIAAGCDGDLVLLGGDYRVLRAWCRGKEVPMGQKSR